MTEARLRALLSRLMVWGIAVAATVMLLGTAIYLSRHGASAPGDRRFTGEPAELTHPLTMVRSALGGDDAAFIQIGVLLLLLNPLVRVALAAIGYGAGGDRLYAGIGALVFAVLVISYFV